MIKLEAFCPKCGDPLEVFGDDSCGMPNEAGTECDCGAIPVWKLEWWVEYELGPFSHYEREGKDDEPPAILDNGYRDELGYPLLD